ncbi:MAG: hypothetical protein WCA77_04020 [Thermoplasmata archaeon]
MPVRPPRLYRWSRLFRRLSIIVLVVIILFLAAVGYSAVQIRPSFSGANATNGTLGANGTVRVYSLLNLSNPGLFALDNVGLSVNVLLPSGSLLTTSKTSAMSVAAGHTASIPISFFFPLPALGRNANLLTNDTNLTTDTWFNATFADVLPFGGFEPATFTWGAPFADFNVTVLSHTFDPSNGTTMAVVQTTFENHAGFPDAGRLTVEVENGLGEVCPMVSTVTIYVVPHGSYNQTNTFYVASGCNGSTLVVLYDGPGFEVTLAKEAV